jgi:large subunit ribosomal protein L15
MNTNKLDSSTFSTTSTSDSSRREKTFNQKRKFNGLRFDEENSKRILGYLPATPGEEKKRRGRGTGSGIGNFSTRGCKGQGQRGSAKKGFEGGQTPWYKRVAKMGFTSRNTQGLKQQESIELEKIITLMVKHGLEKITTKEILSLKNFPFYVKEIKVIGTVEEIPMSVEIQCDGFSKGAEESLKKNNCNFQKIEKIRNHSFRKKNYSPEENNNNKNNE